ncbi:MAG: hypothetical protein ABSB79_14570 [Syntrophales bacterium]
MTHTGVKQGLESFVKNYNTAIGMLKTNYLLDPLLNRKINLIVEDTGQQYLLTLTEELATLEEGISPWANADFAVDEKTWQRLLNGEINTISMVTAGKLYPKGDQVLIVLRFGVIVQLLSLMLGGTKV